MPRGAAIVLIGPAQSRVRDAAARRLDEDPGWARALEAGPLQVWTTPATPLITGRLPDGAGVIVGDLIARPGTPACPAATDRPADPRQWARWLSAHRWGRYLAILADRQGGASVFRDPGGLVDALVWPLGGGVHLLATDLRRTPAGLWPPRHALDWDRIAAYVASPPNHTSDPLFAGMRGVGPGECLGLVDGRRDQVWRPGAFLTPPDADPQVLRDQLVRTVDDCVQALATRHRRLVVEVSGGLDSAIVSTSLSATGHVDRVAHWLNRVVRRAEGDERRYAGAVTDRIGARLTCVTKAVAPLTEADFAELADAAWPAMNGVEAGRDRDDAERLAACGADAIVSGQGGDAIFFQPATPLVVADAWRAGGWGALATSLLPDTARRTHRSVWSVLQAARKGLTARPEAQVTDLVTPAAAEMAQGRQHAWTEDAFDAGAAPAKLMQVQGIANHHVYHGDSRRRRVADVVFPLLAQPLVELCLSIPTPCLAQGGDDRPFARAAFAHRLPDLVRQRRRKGAQSAHFAQLVTASLPTLRPFLLEGNLVAAGVLDRGVLEERLDPQRLIAHPGASQLLWAATSEAWVRHWQTRIPDARASRHWNR